MKPLLEAQQEVITDLVLEKLKAEEKYRTAVSNQKRENFRLHREIKDLSRQLDAIRAVFKNKANDKNWKPGETLDEITERILRERDEAIADRDILRINAQREAEHHDRILGKFEKVYKERDEAREALRTLAEHGENEIQKLIKECDEARNKMADALQEVDLRTLDCERMKQERDEARERAKELAELVDGAYIFVELHKPECKYNEKWREAWMEKAKRLIPGVDSIWY